MVCSLLPSLQSNTFLWIVEFQFLAPSRNEIYV